MPVFKPFGGVRPHQDLVEIFPTHPLSNYTHDEIEKKAEKDFSYVKMISPYLFGKQEDWVKNLQEVRANYETLLEKGNLEKDEPCYYLYNQILPDGRSFRGFLGLVSVEDYHSNKIKKHEETLTHREEKLAGYLEQVSLQAEPVLLTYSANEELERIMNEQEKTTPIINCFDSKKAKYRVWKIVGEDKVKELEKLMASVDSFYIADGHHRMGSTALSAKKKSAENPHHTGEESYNFVYSFVVSDHSVKINDFNKLVKDLNGLTSEEFLEKLGESFSIEKKGDEPYYPTQKQNFSMYLDGDFYSLQLKKDLCVGDCMDIVDHYLLEKYVLQPILGIDCLKTSKKVDYVRGTSCEEGIKNLKEKADKEGYKVGFGAYPVSFDDLVEIADKNLKMPPKCTYIEPKLVTALIMYDMK